MNTLEKNTLSKMIWIYCRIKHRQKESLCSDCKQLEAYAHGRLEHCPFGDKKPVCQKCMIHYYKPEHREKIREVMRFFGPRMLFYHPMDAVRHLWQKLR